MDSWVTKWTIRLPSKFHATNIPSAGRICLARFYSEDLAGEAFQESLASSEFLISAAWTPQHIECIQESNVECLISGRDGVCEEKRRAVWVPKRMDEDDLFLPNGAT